MKKRKVLVLAYMLSPYKGSEFSVAWNYVAYMSKDNDLTVLYGLSGAHMGDCSEMENYVRQHSIPGVKLVPIYPNKFARLLNWPNRHGFLVYTSYFAYQVWHKQTYKIAKQLIKEEHYDLVHYVGMIGYREPGYLWKLGLPYVWGPIGGANNVPVQLLKNMSIKGKLTFLFRNFANFCQLHFNHRLKQALRSTDVLMTATTENHDTFLKIYHKDSICLPENALTEMHQLNIAKFKNIEKIRLIIVGRLCEGKAVRLLLESLTMLRNLGKLHLDIVGDGPEMKNLQEYASKNSLDDIITWYGQLHREDAVKIFETAHLNVITSVSEGNPTTIWEAMSYGVPTISFDHCGMHDTITDTCGIKVPLQKTYDGCVRVFAEALDSVIENPERLCKLAQGTIERASHYMWTEREKILNNMYDKLIAKKNN